jgi:DNA-binding HxlR family transcriptional regulator
VAKPLKIPRPKTARTPTAGALETPAASSPSKHPSVDTSPAPATSRKSSVKLGTVPGGASTEHDHDTFTPELDRLIHERLRLGIVSALAVNDTLSFNELKKLMHTTDGNLSMHARKLEEANYVTCTKTFEGRVPHTQYSLTPLGRKALTRYLDHMEALIRATRER